MKDKVFMGPTDDVQEDSRFREDLGGDSLDAIEVIMELERNYCISINDREGETLCSDNATVKDFIDLTYQKIQERDERRKNLLRHGV